MKGEGQHKVEYVFRQRRGDDGFMKFLIEVKFDNQSYCLLGPYDTESERDRAYEKILAKTRDIGASTVQ